MTQPRMRDWLHAALTPIAVIAGVLLVANAPDGPARTAAVVYGASGLLLFGVSAVFNVGKWHGRIHNILQRLDHANIYLLIAGCYTPVVVTVLDGRTQVVMLVSVWVAAIIGAAFRVLWVHAPRLLYTGLYVAMGWSIVPFAGHLLSASATATFFTFAGGVLYSLGAVVYGIRRPNPVPDWFGFHEVFHAFTVAAWTCHYTAISLLIQRA